MSDAVHSARERFTREQVRRILHLNERQLIAWERQGFVQPAGNPAAGAAESRGQRQRGARRGVSQSCYYTFTDLITLKTLLQLRKSGVPPVRLRLAHAALQRKLAEVEKPWSELQIKGSGKNLTVQWNGATMEAITGQFLLEYAPKDPSGQPRIEPLKREPRTQYRMAERILIAERYFMAGLRYEERLETTGKAIRAYQKAIEINPRAVGAFINLGTIYYNQGQLDEAESAYCSALSLDPGYALVHFNLGNVADEKNELQKAREHYEEATRCDPAYPDPHYNLALVYDRLGLHGKARRQWLRYLQLDQTSQWAAYARIQLERTSLRIVRPRTQSRNTS